MSKLLHATQTKDAFTANGALTHSTSGSHCLDFFFEAGASRGKDLSHKFALAQGENPLRASQLLFWLRDVRGGAGERDLFRSLAKKVITPDNALRFMKLTLEVGRWDDLHVFLGTQYEDLVVSITADALLNDNALAAKWTPRSGTMFNLLRKKMELTPKELRKILVRLSATVEQLMSAGRWNEIDYNKLPSVASSRYMTAFHRQDESRYVAYKNALVKGEKGVKINAGAIFPYDITQKVRHATSDTVRDVSQAQWQALPDYMSGNERKVLPIIDVSSSMDCQVSGSNTRLTCMDVAVSLGLYVSERNKSFFKDHYITFDDTPKLMKVSGPLHTRLNQIYKSPWGGSTNLVKVFDLILNAAVQHKLTQDDLPETVIIFSDMEFNVAFGRQGNYVTVFEAIDQKFKARGYTRPQMVFWRLNTLTGKGNSPVKKGESGTQLVSGFSPSLLKSVLSETAVNPEETMLVAVDVPRYTL